MKLEKDWCDVLKFWRFCDESGSGILCVLKFLNEEDGDVVGEGFAVIEVRCYVSMDYCIVY